MSNSSARSSPFSGRLLVGKINRTTARVILIQKLRQLDYDPGCGFPCERGKPPLVEGPTLDRIDLMIRTEIALTRNERRCREAQDECHKFLFPGWELVLLGCVNPELDSPETRIGEWERRWRAAGDSVKLIGARKPRMMACKDSPIWQALGNGEGGFNDGLKHPFRHLRSKARWIGAPSRAQNGMQARDRVAYRIPLFLKRTAPCSARIAESVICTSNVGF